MVQIPHGSIEEDSFLPLLTDEQMTATHGPRVSLEQLAQDELDAPPAPDDYALRARVYRQMARRAWCGFTNDEVNAEKDRQRMDRYILQARRANDANYEGLRALSQDLNEETARGAVATMAALAAMTGGDARVLYAPIVDIGEQLRKTGMHPAAVAKWAATACSIADTVSEAFAERAKDGRDPSTITKADIAAIPLRPVKAGRTRSRKSAGGPRRASTKTSSGSGDDDPSEPPAACHEAVPYRAQGCARGSVRL
jgi:hypothetical protein